MKILIIEDDEFDYLLLRRNLERAFADRVVKIEWITDPRIEYLLETLDEYDICFVDHGLPTITGTEFIHAMFSAGILTPMILLTGDQRPELDQGALDAGASDFLHKDQISVSSILRSARHSITRKDQEKRLREMAYTDALTGLANRAAFDERCKAALARIEPYGRRLTLLLLDLDDFKKVNDTFGHHYGDKLLQMFAADLKSHFKDCDLVARLGGDEFAVLVETDGDLPVPECARAVLRRAQETQFEIADIKIMAHASIGLYTAETGQPAVTETDLLQRADRNLYADKRRRKFDLAQNTSTDSLAGLDIDETVQDLEKAISSGEFEVYYQPKVSFKSGKITGLEALLRWTGSSDGLGPDVFIPIAEEFGLINDIGTMVLRMCFKQISLWQEQGFDVPPISINVSPQQLENELFSHIVAECLFEFEISPDIIEFELTEGSFSKGADMRIAQMNRIADLGCRWAIDDFGIGYSSLSRLHKLPISKIKIDKSFLFQLPDDHGARDISNTIISMARNLDLSVVAEGVEDARQLDDLHLADTDELQGFLWFKPMNVSSISQLLADRAVEAA